MEPWLRNSGKYQARRTMHIRFMKMLLEIKKKHSSDYNIIVHLRFVL